MKLFSNLKAKNDKFWDKFHDPKTKIARKGKWYSIAPLFIILVGVIMFAIPGVGFNLGLDFTGGAVVEASGFSVESLSDTRREVENFMKQNGITHEISTPKSENGTILGLSVKYQLKSDMDMDKFGEDLRDLIYDTSGITATEAESISAAASGERIMITFISVAVALIAILVYMLFRFRLTSGISAVVGLIHDVLVLVALCIIFRVQINYSFVAALITVVVYSLNNTLVLFDRIRGKEKFNQQKLLTEQIVDASVKETFGRTMGTTITTLVPVLVLCLIGVPLIREFALPILFGLIAGTFSTIFVTTSLYVRFENYRRISKRGKEKKLERQENLV